MEKKRGGRKGEGDIGKGGRRNEKRRGKGGILCSCDCDFSFGKALRQSMQTTVLSKDGSV